jgi:hypothetical protein
VREVRGKDDQGYIFPHAGTYLSVAIILLGIKKISIRFHGMNRNARNETTHVSTAPPTREPSRCKCLALIFASFVNASSFSARMSFDWRLVRSRAFKRFRSRAPKSRTWPPTKSRSTARFSGSTMRMTFRLTSCLQKLLVT